MKKGKVIKTSVESKLNLTDKTAIIILIVLPLLYFAIFAPGLLTGSKMMYGSDWLLGGYPSRVIAAQELAKFNSVPMWYQYIFGGMPLYGGSIYTFIQLVLPTHIFWTYLFVFGLMIAGIGMYLFLKSLDISNPPALVGAVAYMFAGNVISTTYAGHEGKLLAAAFFPVAFFFWNKGIMTRKFYWFVLAGALGGFGMTHAHFQLTYYGLWVAFAYFIVQLIWQWQQNKIRESLKLIGYAVITVVIALGILAVNFMPLLANIASGARGEVRGYEFATSWALPPMELFSLIVPQFSGLLDNYWGENYFKLHTEYFSVILFLLAGLAIYLKLKERRTAFFFGTSIIGTLIALGGHTPFFKIIYYLMPGVKRFRGPSMAFYLVAFSVIVIGTIGLQALFDYNQQKKLFNQNIKKKFKQFIYFTIVVFVFLLAVFLMSKGSVTDPQKIDAFTKNSSFFWRGILISAILILVSLYFFNKLANGKIKLTSFILILIPLILFDQWRIDRKFLKTVENPNVYYAPDEVVSFLRNDTTLYRIHPLYYERSNDGILDLYHIQNAGGYTANPLQTYQDFIGAGQTVMYSAPNLAFPNFLNLLNIKYIISVPLPEDISKYDTRTQAMITDLLNFVSRPGLELAYSGRKYIVYKNSSALPRVFFVPNYEVIKDKDQIFERLKDINFNPQSHVIVSESVPGVESNNSDSFVGTAKVMNYTPNRIIIETEQNTNGFLVLSENYHPDWFCKVDGKLTKVYPVYYTLRTVYLNRGTHKVEFFYYSKFYSIGRIITVVTSLFCVGVIIIVIYKRKIKKQNAESIKV